MEGRIIRTVDEYHAALRAATTRRESVQCLRDALKCPDMADHCRGYHRCCDTIIRRSAKKWTDRS